MFLSNDAGQFEFDQILNELGKRGKAHLKAALIIKRIESSIAQLFKALMN